MNKLTSGYKIAHSSGRRLAAMAPVLGTGMIAGASPAGLTKFIDEITSVVGSHREHAIERKKNDRKAIA